MAKELEKIYEPQEVESRIYRRWLDSGHFHCERDESKKPFTIVMPPPNVTGQLHMGHAWDSTVQDVLIRFKRMQGYAALWMPGTDHAGIATQIKVEEALREEEGLTRYDLGRDKFLDRVWEWKEKYGNRIVEQQMKLGASCDWERARFTMDEGCSAAVREVFVTLYEKGLIYKGSRIINWCPDCVTALSDAEVEYEEKPGNLWHIRYPLVGEEGYLIVATTRPETMLGDSGVAVNPNDERYKHLVGKTCMLPLMNREIPIVADDYVDLDFGTGCVKMTPAHDPNDFEVGLRHNLESIRVLDDNGKINSLGGKYESLDRYAARKQIVADLEELGLLDKIEEHNHNVGTCYRCHKDVEPLVSAQWFVKMQELAEPALDAVRSGKTKFVPDRFSTTYTNWMENVRDWCISRQLWWGHQIPVWYCADCGHMTVARHDPDCCEKCHSTKIKRDPDVLDTWFSSALWPFSTLGWPEKNPDVDYFYPTDVLVTGYDIIFFWVARMIFSGLEQMGETPFHTVFIHGLLRDDKGKKMSKSAGNGIDPLEVIDQYGADALRFFLVTGNSPGNDMRFYTERCEAMRNFANKIWNATRFVQMNLTIDRVELPADLTAEDKWILSKLNALIPEVTDNLDKYELGMAAQKLYDFIWDSYCDWYIELTKTRLQGDDEQAKANAQNVLCHVLIETLTLLHPFMPFLTEEIYGALPKQVGHEDELLIVKAWPTVSAEMDFAAEEREMELLMEAIRVIRARRAEMNVPPGKRSSLLVVSDNGAAYERGTPFLKKLGYSESVTVSATAPADLSGMLSLVTSDARLFLPLAELVDLDAERKRMEKDLAKQTAELEKLETKLGNPGFVAKAPEAVVAAERERAETLRSLISKLQESLQAL